MILRMDRTVQTAQGQAISGASVYVLTQPADVSSLTPLAHVFSSLAGTAAANPATTDGLGQVALYLDNGQLYTLVVVSPLIGTQVYPDQNLGGSTVSAAPFAEVPLGAIDGVNRVFTLTTVPALLYLQYNSATLVPGTGYTIAGNVLTLAVAPVAGDALYASGLRASAAGTAPFQQVPTGAINGVNRTFALTVAPALLFLQYNSGTLVPGLGYTLVGTVLTLAIAPEVGDTLYASGLL